MQSKLLAAGLPHVPQYQTKHSASSTGCLLFASLIHHFLAGLCAASVWGSA